jgi:hypothetical protein
MLRIHYHDRRTLLFPCVLRLWLSSFLDLQLGEGFPVATAAGFCTGEDETGFGLVLPVYACEIGAATGLVDWVCGPGVTDVVAGL